jgi:hypothetical protein
MATVIDRRYRIAWRAVNMAAVIDRRYRIVSDEETIHI